MGREDVKLNDISTIQDKNTYGHPSQDRSYHQAGGHQDRGGFNGQGGYNGGNGNQDRAYHSGGQGHHLHDSNVIVAYANPVTPESYATAAEPPPAINNYTNSTAPATVTSAIVTMTSTPSSGRVTDLFDTERGTGADPGSQVCGGF